MPMPSIWAQHLKDPTARKEFEDMVRNSLHKTVVDRMNEIITRALAEMDSEARGLKQYETASWGYRQAHLNGYSHALKMVKDLINVV